jgi:acyl transferase domain-containing protein
VTDSDLDVAIVGMALRVPGADTPEGFWRNLAGGVESIERFPADEGRLPDRMRRLGAGATYVPAQGVLTDATRFDAEFFGLAPRECELMDPQHRQMIEVAWEAFETAAIEPGQVPTAVFAGAGFPAYLLWGLWDSPDLAGDGQYSLTIGNDKDHTATRTAHALNLRGPAATVQNACATSLVCVHLACQSLLAGESDLALAGASAVSYPQRTGYYVVDGGILSPDGHCRPFDVRAQGTVPGSGVGAVLLKRLAEARRDGDPVRAVIRATAIGNDGANRLSYAAPSVPGQAAVIEGALRFAGVKPAEVTYVETHGTATPLGDPIEIAALTRAMPGDPDPDNPCYLGAVKSNIGHLDVAAGMAGLIKTVLALEHELIPPTLHFTEPSPRLELGRTRFTVADRPVAWPRGDRPRLAGVSSFGLGGVNTHAIVAEAPPLPGPPPGAVVPRPGDTVPLLLSADSTAALDTLADRLHDVIGPDLAPAARSLAFGRRHRRYRRAITAGSPERARDLLHRIRHAETAGEGRVALVFSGAGKHPAADAVALLDCEAFAAAYQEVGEAFAAQDQRLAAPGEIAAAADDLLLRPTIALPALFAAQVALARLYEQLGVRPAVVLGHSTGEYAAAHVAGVMALPAAARLISARADLLERGAAGQMAVVPLAREEAQELASRFGLTVAAVNTPASCLLSGEKASFAAFTEYCAAHRIDSRVVGIGVAAHSPLLNDAAAELTALARATELRPPAVCYVSAVTGAAAGAGVVDQPEYWGEHLRRPVLFAAAVAATADLADVFVEIGSADTVAPFVTAGGTVRASQTVRSLPHPREQVSCATRLTQALGTLWEHGVAVRWDPWLDRAGRRAALPATPFSGASYDIGRAAPVPAVAAETAGPTVYEPVWRRVPATTHRPVITGRWVVAGPASALREELRARLGDAGADVAAVDVADLLPAGGDRVDFDDLSRRLGEALSPAGADGAVYLSAEPATSQGYDGPAFAVPFALARMLGGMSDRPARLLVATPGVFDVLGNEAGAPYSALAAGPALVAGHEYPRLTSALLDLDPAASPAQNADAILAELAGTDGDEVAALRAGRRWARAWQPVPPPGELADPADLGVVLITGGLGGLGTAILDRLAQHGVASVALLGRTGLPDREPAPPAQGRPGQGRPGQGRPGTAGPREDPAAAARAVRAAQARGTRVEIVIADVADTAALRRAVHQVTGRLGPIRTVIHAAGTPGGGLIRLRRYDDCRALLRPKVDGVRALAAALEGQPVERVLLCSALDAILGTPGQCDHVAANAFLDAVPQAGWFGQATVTSVNWGAWRDVGQAADLAGVGGLAAWRSRALETAITPAAGADLACRLLSAGTARAAVSTADIAGLLRQVRERDLVSLFEEEPPDQRAEAARPRPLPAETYQAPQGPIATALARIWSAVIGVAPVGATDDYFALGGHSLAAIALVSRMRQLFDFPIALVDVLERPTVAAQAAWLQGQLDRYLESIPDAEVERQLATGPLSPATASRRVDGHLC